jgi:hypothetical protein
MLDKKEARYAIGFIGGYILLWLAVMGAIGYTIVHFVKKFW